MGVRGMLLIVWWRHGEYRNRKDRGSNKYALPSAKIANNEPKASSIGLFLSSRTIDRVLDQIPRGVHVSPESHHELRRGISQTQPPETIRPQPNMAQNNPHASHTPAIFRQLHIKLPTPKPCYPAPDWKGDRPSDDWLKKHPKGFLLMHNLNPKHPMGKCMLVESIDTGELFVNKRFRRLAPFFRDEDKEFSDPIWEYGYSTPSPPELRFSTLKDPRVEAQLPDEPYFTKLHACGWPMGKKGPYNEQRPSDAHSLYFQHYNGGTLWNLMKMYSDCRNGAPVPESFIWHVVEQLSRAVLYLHYGFTARSSRPRARL
jgi:hypothetical protein